MARSFEAKPGDLEAKPFEAKPLEATGGGVQVRSFCLTFYRVSAPLGTHQQQLSPPAAQKRLASQGGHTRPDVFGLPSDDRGLTDRVSAGPEGGAGEAPCRSAS